MATLTQDILTSGIVGIAVGPEEIPFDAHIELLCAHSPYFDEALEDRFDSPGTQYLTLPEDDPKIFTKVLSWMYNTRIGVSVLAESTTWELLCKIWLLADKYARKYDASGEGRGNLDPSLIKLVYDKTCASSQLRHAIIAICSWDMEAEHFRKYVGSFPLEFKHDYAVQQAQRNVNKWGTKMPLTWSPKDFYTRKPSESPLPKQQAAVKQQKTEPLAGHGGYTLSARTIPISPVDEPRVATPESTNTREIRTPKGRRSASGAPMSLSLIPSLGTPQVATPRSEVDALADELDEQL
ncbi:hypothetical protein BU23DRAFT_571817 [Bimuria novae-zelandiae CBS 107.79]|uniref:BTB domain-containing protein n=1 Tax=Bimuria novae-zelandiae CBS 107.79 TaxID=1447943 RepID=A0A6A5V214_9PLEO|nr:hypothetical protein BU23DRAFT_571817 [Bimuria novae-zelandiae CBS 107.79]